MEGRERTGYALFAALHEDRLVLSLVSETGLSNATARGIARDVLPSAFERGFASDGAAYGWLRVAARHRAADSAAWADAADAALVQADLAAAALATLPADTRELLRLRYVDGLLPAALAERLGTTVPDVLARLEVARVAATRELPAARRTRMALRVPVQRVGAAVAAAAAIALLATAGTSPAPRTPTASAPRPFELDSSAPEPTVHTHARPVPARAVDTAADVAPRDVVVRDHVRPAPPVDDDDPSAPGGQCKAPCLPKRIGDEVHVAVPAGLTTVVGEDEVVVKQQYLDVCDTVPGPPENVARCVPGDAPLDS